MQHDILDRMGRAEILALAVGGTNEVFLVLCKVGSEALIHFTTALCAIQKPGEHINAALPFMDADMRELAERTMQKVDALTETEYDELAVYAADEV